MVTLQEAFIRKFKGHPHYGNIFLELGQVFHARNCSRDIRIPEHPFEGCLVGADFSRNSGCIPACLRLHGDDSDICPGSPFDRKNNILVAFKVDGHKRRIKEPVRVIHKGIEHFSLIFMRGDAAETHLALHFQLDGALPASPERISCLYSVRL